MKKNIILVVISIINSLGQEVIRSGRNIRKINVGNLIPGLYVIELRMEEETVLKKLYIK